VVGASERYLGVEAGFDAVDARYYDLVVGLHPDEATQAVALSALITRTLLVPCCNFWDRSRRLGTLELAGAIESFFRSHGVEFDRLTIPLDTPKNIALITTPPTLRIDLSTVALPPLAPLPGQEAGREIWLKQKKRQGKGSKPES
jgi:hypothetical protein